MYLNSCQVSCQHCALYKFIYLLTGVWQETDEAVIVDVLSSSWQRVVELQRNSLFRPALKSFIHLTFHPVFLRFPADSDVSVFQQQVTLKLQHFCCILWLSRVALLLPLFMCTWQGNISCISRKTVGSFFAGEAFPTVIECHHHSCHHIISYRRP